MLQELRQEEEAVPQNLSGCPEPTVTCSPGGLSPSRPAQDSWGQAGDTPGTPRLPGSGKARQLPSDVQEKGWHQCHPQPARSSPGMARGGGRGCQPSGPAARLIKATSCHSGCSAGGTPSAAGTPGTGGQSLCTSRHVWQPLGTAGGTAGGQRERTRHHPATPRLRGRGQAEQGAGGQR